MKPLPVSGRSVPAGPTPAAAAAQVFLRRWLFDTFGIGFACAIGGSVHCSFQRDVRRNYLANQLLSESANRDSLATGAFRVTRERRRKSG